MVEACDSLERIEVHRLVQDLGKPDVLAPVHSLLVCVGCQGDHLTGGIRTKLFLVLFLVSQDLLGRLEPVHHRHHQIHYYEFEKFGRAVLVCALEIEPLFEFIHGFLPVSGLFREDRVVQDA